MFKTKNDLSEGARVKAVELLNARLADATDLQTQIKQAHWNVKGPSFIALGELFDKINEEVEDYVDDIAERAVQLGGVAARRSPQNSCHRFLAPALSQHTLQFPIAFFRRIPIRARHSGSDTPGARAGGRVLADREHGHGDAVSHPDPRTGWNRGDQQCGVS
jgi:starvation-inducible DNA-binding protein